MTARGTAERLVVLARAPRLGRVKTRLCPPLTAEQALALHRALVEDSLERLGRIERPGLERWISLSEPLGGPDELVVPEGWTTSLQGEGDLGARLAACFRAAFEAGIERLVALGSDSPTIPYAAVDEAFDDLARVDVVVGPALDGGYYLLGARRFVPELFVGIEWGGPTVLADTERVLRTKGVAYAKTPPWYDIDTESDLVRLREEIQYLRRDAPEEVPRRVAAILDSDALRRALRHFP